MKRYVIKHIQSGLFVKNRINDELLFVSYVSDALIFNYLTLALEFGEKYINDGYDVYELVLKKV